MGGEVHDAGVLLWHLYHETKQRCLTCNWKSGEACYQEMWIWILRAHR